MQTPPYSAATCPSSDVPTPNAMTGTRAAWQSAHDRRDLLVRVREHDDVGQRGVGEAFAVAVLLADRVRRHARDRRSRCAVAPTSARDVGVGLRTRRAIR